MTELLTCHGIHALTNIAALDIETGRIALALMTSNGTLINVSLAVRSSITSPCAVTRDQALSFGTSSAVLAGRRTAACGLALKLHVNFHHLFCLPL